MTTIIFLLVCLVLAITYIFKSLVTIESNETGWRTIFGANGKALEPGLNFCPWLISKLVIYEKTPLIFKFKVASAMTKNGVVKNYKEDSGEIERADIDIILTLTTFFDHNNLAHTAANAPGVDAKSLAPAIRPFIVGIFRSIASEMPWPLLNGERTKVIDYALSKIKPEYEYYGVDFALDQKSKSNIYFFKDTKDRGETIDLMRSKNPLVKFGLDVDNTTIEIEDINFSRKELADAFNLAEQARLTGESRRIANKIDVQKTIDDGLANNKISANKILEEGLKTDEVNKINGLTLADNKRKEGDALAYNIEREGEALSKARKLMIAEIKDNPDLEYLRTLEQMAKGTSNTILYQIPKSFEEKVSTIMGGSKPEDFFSLLKDEKIVNALKEALEKLKNN